MSSLFLLYLKKLFNGIVVLLFQYGMVYNIVNRDNKFGMKSKLSRKTVYKKYKPSMSVYLDEQQQTLQQKACNKLKQQSLMSFVTELNNQEENPFLCRNFRFQHRNSDFQIRNKQNSLPCSSMEKQKPKPKNYTLPIMPSQQKLNIEKKRGKSMSTSPRKMHALNLTQYIIIDSSTKQVPSPLKFIPHNLQRKYTNALSHLVRKKRSTSLNSHQHVGRERSRLKFREDRAVGL